MDTTNIDFSPLDTTYAKIALELPVTRALLHAERPILPDSSYVGGHPSAALGEAELVDATRMRLFAEANNMTFFGNLQGVFPAPDSVFAHASIMSRFRAITFGCITKTTAGWCEIGELRLETASYIQQYDRCYIYVKVLMDSKLPCFSIDAVDSALFPSYRGNLQSYVTESTEFNKIFCIRAKKGEVSNALSILTPDTMAILIDNFEGVDIDIHDNQLFCVLPWDGITNPDSLRATLEAMRSLQDVLHSPRNRVSHDSNPNNISAYLKKYNYIHAPIADQKRASRLFALKAFLFSLVATIVMILLGLAVVTSN